MFWRGSGSMGVLSRAGARSRCAAALVALVALACGAPARCAYWGSKEAYEKLPYEFVPHGNFFNSLPAVPDAVRAAMPPQDGSIGWGRAILHHNRDLYRAGHPMAKQLVKALLVQSNLVYDTYPIRTVTEKPLAPPNGDRRFYWSIGPYFWPQPDTPNGEPYFRRDGVFNADLARTHPDNIWLRDTIDACKWLGLGFFFTGERKFAEQLRRRVYTFFLDEATGMAPSLKYAQSIPGIAEGRPQGTIDMRHIGHLLDAVRLVAAEDATAWNATDEAALRGWATRFMDGWLSTQVIARTERASENNHGNYYDVQYISFAKYLGRWDDALRAAHFAKFRCEKQIRGGVQPFEFVRASSVHYLTFNTKALSRLAVLCNTLGVDLWHAGLRHGSALKDAWDFALPHVMTRVAHWPWKQVNDEFNFDRFGEIFADVYRAYAGGAGVGPHAYLVMSRDFWASPDFLARFQGDYLKAFMADNLFRIEADSDFALASLPEPPCEGLSCDAFSRGVLIAAGLSLLACIACVAYNNLSYYVAERTPGLPPALKELADQQERILTKDAHLYIRQLAPKAYVSPIFTRHVKPDSSGGGGAKS